MLRVHLTPWRWWPLADRLYLHIFYRPDADPDPHDHPFDFGSFVLWGGYDEMIWSAPEAWSTRTVDGVYQTRPALYLHVRRLWTWKRVRAEHTHMISRLHRTPTITLVVRGPKRRDWAFWVPGNGSPIAVPWHDYIGIPPQASAHGD